MGDVTEARARLVVRTGPLVVDTAAALVTRHGTPVPLTRLERALLEALAARLDQVATHRVLLSTVWGEQYDDPYYLRIYVRTLRRKLEDDPSRPRLLLTEWGIGYRLAALPPQPVARHMEALNVG